MQQLPLNYASEADAQNAATIAQELGGFVRQRKANPLAIVIVATPDVLSRIRQALAVPVAEETAPVEPLPPDASAASA